MTMSGTFAAYSAIALALCISLLSVLIAPTTAQLAVGTVWVDATYGNDVTGVLYNQSRPYKTLAAAIADIPQGDLANPVKLYLRPGQYAGATLPNNVFLQGEGKATIIKSTLTVNGNSQISDLAISHTSGNALQIQTASIAVLVDINNIFVTTTYNTAQPSYVVVNNIMGYTTIRNSYFNIAVKVSTTIAEAYFIYTGPGSELDMTDCTVQASVKGTAQTLILYENVGTTEGASDETNLKVDGGFSKLSLSDKSTGNLYLARTARANLRFDYVIINMNGPHGAFVKATGDNTVKFGLSTLNYKNFLDFNSAVGISHGGYMPDVRFIGDALVQDTFPLPAGNFTRYDVTVSDVQGVVTGGALVVGIKELPKGTAAYQWSNRDSTLIVDDEIDVVVNMTSPLVLGESGSGRVAIIKNSCPKANVTLVGSIFGGSQMVDPGLAAILVAGADDWYVMLTGHVNRPSPVSIEDPSPVPGDGSGDGDGGDGDSASSAARLSTLFALLF